MRGACPSYLMRRSQSWVCQCLARRAACTAGPTSAWLAQPRCTPRRPAARSSRPASACATSALPKALGSLHKNAMKTWRELRLSPSTGLSPGCLRVGSPSPPCSCLPPGSVPARAAPAAQAAARRGRQALQQRQRPGTTGGGAGRTGVGARPAGRPSRPGITWPILPHSLTVLESWPCASHCTSTSDALE